MNLCPPPALAHPRAPPTRAPPPKGITVATLGALVLVQLIRHGGTDSPAYLIGFYLSGALNQVPGFVGVQAAGGGDSPPCGPETSVHRARLTPPPPCPPPPTPGLPGHRRPPGCHRLLLQRLHYGVQPHVRRDPGRRGGAAGAVHERIPGGAGRRCARTAFHPQSGPGPLQSSLAHSILPRPAQSHNGSVPADGPHPGRRRPRPPPRPDPAGAAAGNAFTISNVLAAKAVMGLQSVPEAQFLKRTLPLGLLMCIVAQVGGWVGGGAPVAAPAAPAARAAACRRPPGSRRQVQRPTHPAPPSLPAGPLPAAPPRRRLG
jgi:hypothetical protein